MTPTARDLEEQARQAFALLGSADSIIGAFLHEAAFAQRAGVQADAGLQQRARDWRAAHDRLMARPDVAEREP